MNSNLTADSELLSTLHDRLRRAERQVEKITLQEARRYGMVEKQSNGRIKYTYAGHVFIFDPLRNKAITSWKIDPNRLPGGVVKKKKVKEAKSGTQFYKPVLILESLDHRDPDIVQSHETISAHVQVDKEKWNSHTVMVIDCSGSMREDDVDGARCRSDAVWTSLARDFVRAQLESKNCSVYDVVSIVLMNKTAKVVVECEPLTYVLYNKLVAFREWDNVKPLGPGYYRPALLKAAELLAMNGSGSCALTLMFFSDGKPSDYHQNNGDNFNQREYNKSIDELVQLSGHLASRFGRRLNIEFIGMAGGDENFKTMERMAEEAKMFGALASFSRPSLSAASLSRVISSSLASSLSSRLEMTSVKAGMTRSVRTDVERERQNAPDDVKVSSDWRVFHATSEESYVGNVWTWSTAANEFARVIDPRCMSCYKVVAIAAYTFLPDGGGMCLGCKGCYFCARCLVTGAAQSHRSSTECLEYKQARRHGFLVGNSKCPLAFSVAWKKKAFGEGAERLAFKFRFIDNKNRFIGPVMVAKESRFTEDLNDVRSGTNAEYLSSHRHLYHKSFMRTQAAAERFAKRFNKSLDEFNELHRRGYPTIQFVDPLIFELEDSKTARTYNVLVEPMIEGKYMKFSDNFGALAPDIKKRDFSVENAGVDLNEAAVLLGREYNGNEAKPSAHPTNLGIIEEGSEDEEDDEYYSDSDPEDSRGGYSDSDTESIIDVTTVRDTDFLATFSHFTYVRSGGTLMVVDLQGALQMKGSQMCFVLTDPAIHHRRNRTERQRQYGRTDLGRKGMRAFFETHRCNAICRLFQFREKKDVEELDKLYKADKLG